MATYADIEMEWSALCPDTPECWTETDLQLAAELGKTLLERNKDLENTLRQQQTIVDDQTQEIEYLTKQTAALREVNDSRLRIYEQLEVSIQELERNNQRLALENAADKKQIKSLCHSLDAMETRCEELGRSLEEAQAAERKHQRSRESSAAPDGDTTNTQTPSSPKRSEVASEEEHLAQQVSLLRAQKTREHQRAEELEEQLTTLIQENATLEEQISSYKMREDQLRSLEEEIASMQGQHVCFRCMRRMGGEVPSTATPSLMDEDMSSSIMEDESCLDDETDLETEVQSIASETHNTVLSDNPYRVLVEKYEALLSMQRRPARRSGASSAATLQGKASPGPGFLGRLCGSPLPSMTQESNCLSLQEELQLSGEFNSGPVSLMLEDFSKVEEGEPREQRQTTGPGQQLYFSEAETNSSSGVSEGDLPRQQHRATQTDLMSGGGKLLWTISAPGAGAADCVVSVYDEGGVDPTESRFQRAPEYRELFSEIFTVLKRSVARSNTAAANTAAAQAAAAQVTTAVTSEHKDAPTTAAESKGKSTVKSPVKITEPIIEVAGQADKHDEEAGKIEEITRTDETSPSSILSLAGQSRKSRKSKSRKERKAEQLRRKVLALSPERLSQEAKKEEQQNGHPSRDQSPALSERSDRSSKKGGRHWAKRGRPLQIGGPVWPWTRWQQQHTHAPSPLAATTSSSSQQQAPPAPGPSNENKPPPIGFTSSASADVARLKRLEKSYAEALRSSLPKTQRRK